MAGECLRCGRVHREPQPGPQTDFILSDAEIRVFAGAMGTGKTNALLLDWLIRGAAVDGANGLICRRYSADITIGGGLWDEAKKVFAYGHPSSEVVMREGSAMDAVWPSTGAKLSFRHLKENSVTRKKGPGFTAVYVEEADECEMESILWLLQRMRSVSGIRPGLAVSTNPSPFHPLREWVDWYVLTLDDGSPLPSGAAPLDPRKSGVIRYTMAHSSTGRRVFGATPEDVAELAEGRPEDAMSYTVITSKLEDNVILEAMDPRYRSKFAQMKPDERAKNLHADWNATPDLTGMVSWPRWRLVDEPLAPLVRASRGWDSAYTKATQNNTASGGPDYTASGLLRWDTLGNAYLCGASFCREDPPEMLSHQRNVATTDGRAVTQACYTDPAAGKGFAETQRQNFRSSRRCGPVDFVPAGSKKGQKISNATPLAKALQQGRVYALVGDWMDEPYRDGGTAPGTIGELIRSQLNPFPDPDDKVKDDFVDAVARAFNHGDRGPQVDTAKPTRETLKEAARELRRRRQARQR